MSRWVFPYVEQEHPVFGKMTRPVIRLAIFSERFRKWLNVNNILVDTGADISVIPLPLGQILVTEVELGHPIQLGGVLSSNSMANGFVHPMQIRLDSFQFEMPIAISTSLTIPPILGRQQALDCFKVSLHYGRELILES